MLPPILLALRFKRGRTCCGTRHCTRWLSELQGGSFKNGFASGAIGSLGGSVFQATVGAKFANSIGGTVGFSALSGGVGAELSGGNFWRGAGTGATIGLLNHCAHKIENDVNEKQASKKVGKQVAEEMFSGVSLANQKMDYQIHTIQG